MKKFSSLVLLVMLFMAQSLLAAQIKGLVVDKKTGEPLIGANVIVKGSTIGAATDVDGYFVFDYNPSGPFTLVVSYIGYKTVEKEFSPSDNLSNLVFEMEEDYLETDVVVVTGIASKTSKAVSDVAVSRVSAEKLTEVKDYSDVSSLLNGKIAGVKVSSSSGNVGGGFRFDIRSGGGLNGSGQPVIYVDGVRVETGEIEGAGAGGQGYNILASLNPDDIESIEILKGPAASASYGTDGSNGVVLIKTKRGKLTGKDNALKISYKNTVGYHTQSYEYKKEDFLSADAANEVYQNGWIRKNFLSFSGGTGVTRFFVSFADNFEQGILPSNSAKNQSVRLNLDATPNDKLLLTATANYSKVKNRRPENDNNIYGYLGNTLLAPFGTLTYYFLPKEDIVRIEDVFKQNRFIGSIRANYKPIGALEINTLVGVDYNSLVNRKYYPRDGEYLADEGEVYILNRYTTRYTYDLNVQYKYNVTKDIYVNSIVGAQILDSKVESNSADAQQIPSKIIRSLGSGGKMVDMGEGFSHFKKAGIFTEHNISYQEKLFVNLMVRKDYSSNYLGKSFNVIYPKISTAIRLDRLGLQLPYVSLLKLRTAYGETGQLPGLFDQVPLVWGAAQSGYRPGAVLTVIGNKDLEPERIKELETGLDIDILDRVSLGLTFSYLKANQSIIYKENAPSTGLTVTGVPYNLGALHGYSFESELKWNVLRSRNYNLNVILINSYQTNTVDDLGGAPPIFDGFDVNVIKKGLPKYEFLVYKTARAVYDNNGNYIGAEATSDLVDMGNPVPEYTGSFNLDMQLFQFVNFYVLADWALGHKIYNNTRNFAIQFLNDAERTKLEDQLSNLTPGTAEYQQVAEKLAKTEVSDIYGRPLDGNFIEDADYLKIREISLSFDLTKALKSYFDFSKYVSRVTLAFNAYNVLTLTKYSGADPEVNFDGTRSLSRGQDFLTLQHPRTYTMTLRVDL